MEESASKFTANVPDDLLTEILIRLPDAGVAIRLATVSKLWQSVIINPHFRRRFAQHRAAERYPDRSILFKCTYKSKVPFFNLPLKDSEYRQPEPYDLSFMPDPAPLEIKAAWGDLLLVARTRETNSRTWLKAALQYYICNSRTREWFDLPEIPQFNCFQDWVYTFSLGSYGHALVFDPHNKLRYKVSVVYFSYFLGGKYSFQAAVYDSDTAQWTFPMFSMPHEAPDSSTSNPGDLLIAVTSNGILHWLDGLCKLRGVVTFDPFTNQFRLIRLPFGQFAGIKAYGERDKALLGVVCDRLRLLRLQKIDDGCFGLRIWELDSDGDSWNLVHDIALDTCGVAADTMLFSTLAFDPSNDNVIFLVRNKKIYRYHIDQDFHERLCDFPISCCVDDKESIEKIKEFVSHFLRVSTSVHPSWPTQIPFG